jgi:hypothetical protein
VIYRDVLQQANLVAFVDLFYVLGILFLVAVPSTPQPWGSTAPPTW